MSTPNRLHVILLSIALSLLPVLCNVEPAVLIKNQTPSSPVPSPAIVDDGDFLFHSSKSFSSSVDKRNFDNSEEGRYNVNSKNLKSSKEIFRTDNNEEKLYLLSSASASALLSSSTLSVDELPKPQIEQKYSTTGSTSNLSKENSKDEGKHHHNKHQHHNNKHHNKKRHHKVRAFAYIMFVFNLMRYVK